MYAVDLFDRNNPRSVINLLPPSAQAKVFSASHDRPDLFRMNEKELKRATKPTATECRLRLAFWNEFNESSAANSPMVMANVYTGICTQQYFDSRVMNEATSLAWLLCPPSDYIVAMEEMLLISQSRLREILEEDPVNEAGDVNVKLGELQLKIHLAIENRLRGSTVQRTQLLAHIKSENTNTNVSAEIQGITPAQAELAVNQALKGMNLEEIEEKLARVRKAQAKVLPAITTDGEKQGE